MSRDDALLFDMIQSAEIALSHARGHTVDTFNENVTVQDAVVRRLEIIGEAARGVSDDTRSYIPEIPWAQVVGMRHRLAHDYLHVDLRVVWYVVEHELAPMIRAIRRYLGDRPAPGGSP